jgi:hypothetical protein
MQDSVVPNRGPGESPTPLIAAVGAGLAPPAPLPPASALSPVELVVEAPDF